MQTIRDVVLGAEVIGCSMLLGAGLYESVVNVPNFLTNIPTSLLHAKQFWSVANPGNFFRIIAPATELLALISVLLCWHTPAGRRWWLVAALVCIIAADIVTFTFHYPRNDLMLTDPPGTVCRGT